MTTVNIKICQGTTCFVMGGGNLQATAEILKNKYREKIAIETVRCLEVCSQKGNFSKAPFAMVNDELISDANLEKIERKIEENL